MKCVIVIDKDLPVGIIANTAAALGVSLAGGVNGLTGNNIKDKDGIEHSGVTNIPIPILALSKDELKEKYYEIIEKDDQEIKIIGFNDVAQKSLNYNDYEDKLATKCKDHIAFLGLCIYGPRNKVNKLTGNLKMLK